MNREEILKAAQSGQMETGEYEKNIARKAIMYGAAVGVALCVIMYVVELLVLKRFDMGKPAMLFAISGFANLYEGRKCREKKKFTCGLMEMLGAALCLLLYIGAFFI